MLVVDDFSNVGLVLGLKDESSPTVTNAFCSFLASDRPLFAIHRAVGCIGSLQTDNRLEFNDEVKDMLAGMNSRKELTPVDAAKRNGRAERKLALIQEGARAAHLKFPPEFPDLQSLQKALNWQAIWPETFSWMNDCLNISARVDDKPDMLCA